MSGPETPAARDVIWERPVRAGRGPAPSLTRDQIAAAAVALADARGIDALSMRTLATALGVGAASLYRYVVRKDELIDLMVDAVMGSDLRFEVRGDWREDMRSYAHAQRTMTLAHPWMALEGAGRASLGPNTVRRYEEGLSAFDGLGLEIDETLVMIETLNAFVRGRTLAEISEREAVRRSGLDRNAWMEAQSPHVTRLVESGRYPRVIRVILDAHAPHDPDRLEHDFTIGLERVLDGLETMLPRARATKPVRAPEQPG